MGRKRKAFSLLAVVLILVSALSACRGAASEPQKLVYGLTLVPSGIDPHIHASSELGIPLNSVYDTLVYLDPITGDFVPGLATEWTISADGLAYTFELRQDVKFHDGTRFNAQAVKVNLERVVNPDTSSQKARFMLGQFEGVEVADDYTAVVRLSAPYAPLLDSLSQVYLGMASPTALEQWGTADYQFHQVGTGPYKFVEYVPSDHLLLERNPAYKWGPPFLLNDGTAHIEQIEFRFYQDPATRAIALESGQVDVMGEIPPQDAGRLESDPNFTLHPIKLPGQPLQLFFNTARTPTSIPVVRQALAMAVDRATVAETIFGEWSPVADGPLTAVTPGHVGGYGEQYPFDPSRAAALLEQAGWIDEDGDGVREQDGAPLSIELYYMGWGLMPEVSQMLENAWTAVGVQVNSQLVSYPAALEAGSNGDHHVIPFNLFGTDPAQLNNFYTSGGGFNWSKVSSSELDELLSSAAAVSDWDERLPLYTLAQTWMIEQVLFLPIRDYVNLNATSSAVKDLRYDARGWFPYLVDVRLEK